MSLSKLYLGSDAFGIHQQTSDTILAEYLTERIELNQLVSWHRHGF